MGTSGFGGFGKRIRRLRNDVGITQRELADASGISTSYLSMIETGELPPPIEEKVRAMAKHLGANEEELATLADRLQSDVEDIIRERAVLMNVLVRLVDFLPGPALVELVRYVQFVLQSRRSRDRGKQAEARTRNALHTFYECYGWPGQEEAEQEFEARKRK